MSGHNKWSQIKHQKGAVDKKRSVVFSKILKAIAIAARAEPNPNFNPRLRTMIEKAKENNVPRENIERAIRKTTNNDTLEELAIEAYGPEGAALIITAITENHNQTINEIKHLLTEYEAKIANPGSVSWAFDGETAKFPQKISVENQEKINQLINALEDRDDVQKVVTNTTKPQ